MKTKRIVSSVLAALMLATSVPQTAFVSRYATVYAEEAEIPEGISYKDRVLTAKYTITDAVSYEYQWVTKSDTDSDYHKYPSDTNQTYYITPRDKNMTLNCYVTGFDAEGNQIGESVLAGGDYKVTSLGKNGRTSSGSTAFTNETTPATYKFRTINYNREYILLDESYDGDNDSTFYVMTDWLGQNMVFDTVGQTTDEDGKITYGGYYFNPEKETNIGYKLNHNEWFLDNWTFDTDMERYINKNHVWWTEAGYSGWVPDDYFFTAGFSLISLSEAVKYREKIGWNLRTNAWWWTRSPRDNVNMPANVLCCKGAAEIWDVPVNQTYLNSNNQKPLLEAIPFVRPTFYLSNDFFKNVRLKVFTNDDPTKDKVIGDEVCKMLVRRYTREEIATVGYTDEELSAIGYEAPKVAKVTLEKGDSTGAQTITATVSDNKTGIEEYSYQWLTSSDNKTWTELPTETSNVYRVSSRDKNQYIACKVIFGDDEPIEVQSSKSEQITDLNKQNRLSNENQAIFANTTPSRYKFTVGDKEYILLDRFNDENSAYYIMSEGYFGAIRDSEGKATGTPFDTDVTKVKLDTTSPTNIAYKLNNEIDNNKINGEAIDKNIVDHINKNYTWWTEKGNTDGITSDYSTTMAVGLLSMSEANKYIEKFGAMPNGQNVFWWIRTQRGQNVDTANVMVGKPGTPNSIDSIEMKEGLTGEIGYGPASYVSDNRSLVARPTFYLDSDFFKEVKVTVFDANKKNVLGDDVRKEILRVNPTAADLENVGYTSAEISAILYPDSVDAISMTESDLNIYNRSDLKFNVNIETTGNVVVQYSNGEGVTGEYTCNNVVDSYTGTFALDKLPNGTNHVEIKVLVNDEVKSVFYKTLYVVPNVSTTNNGTRPGIGLHLNDMQNTHSDIDFITAAHKLGFNDIRLGWTWGRGENDNGYTFEKYKPFMDTAKNLNMNVTQNLSYNLKKYSGSENDKDAIDTEAERTAFANYAKALVTEFKDYPNMKKVEVWNEPNATSFWNSGQESNTTQTAAQAKNYADLVKAVSDAVKSVKSDVTVYGGALDVSRDKLSDDTSNTSYGYTKELFKNGAYNSMDVLSFHPYNHVTYSFDSFVKKSILSYEDVILDNGGFKKLAATEFGQSTDNNGNDAAKQAREVPKAFIQLVAYGVENAEMFNFIDSNENFGLFDKNSKANDLLYTVAQVNSILDGATFVGNVNGTDGTTTDCEGYCFVKGDELIMASWVTSGESIPLTLTGSEKLYDSFGNEIETTGETYSLGSDIVYAVIDVDGIATALEALDKAKATEIATRMQERFGEKLPTGLVEEDDSLTGYGLAIQAIENSNLTDVEKSACYSLYYDYLRVSANIMAVTASSEEISGMLSESANVLDYYNWLCASANRSNNAYAKAVLKYAEECIAENSLNISDKQKYANYNVIEYLLTVADTMLKPIAIGSIAPNDEQNKITITLRNKDGNEFDLFVATYDDDGNFENIQAFDQTSESYVADYDKSKVNKIFVWSKGTMIPLDEATYEPEAN